MTKIEVNRVGELYDEWSERVGKEYKRIPNLDDNKAFQAKKLDYLEKLEQRFGKTTNPNERFTLDLLIEQRRELEHKLYPKRVSKFLHRLKVVLFKKKDIVEGVKLEQNLSTIKDVLRKAGLSAVGTKLERALENKAGFFTIPVSHYINEHEQMSFDVSFRTDINGKCQLIGYAATLKDQNVPTQARVHEFEFDGKMLMPAEQAQHLLSGRAVHNDGQKWVQLDLNDRDPMGNYKVKELSESYHFDLYQAIEALPIKGSRHDLLAKDLALGKKVDVVLQSETGERHISIAANPMKGTLDLYNTTGTKVTLDEALGKKPAVKVDSPTVRAAVNKRNSIKVRA